MNWFTNNIDQILIGISVIAMAVAGLTKKSPRCKVYYIPFLIFGISGLILGTINLLAEYSTGNSVLDWCRINDRMAFVIAGISGAIFSAIGLAKKYPTKLYYVYLTIMSWFYLIFSVLGSLLITKIMVEVGTKVIKNDYLNDIVLGLIGSGVFLQIIDRFAVTTETYKPKDNSKATGNPQAKENNKITEAFNSEVETHLITIRNYLYNFLDERIGIKVRQEVESEIRNAVENVGLDSILNLATQLIQGIDKLEAEERKKILEKYRTFADNGDGIAIIRDLALENRGYELRYIIREIRKESDVVSEAESKIKDRVKHMGIESFLMLVRTLIQNTNLKPEEDIKKILSKCDQFADIGNFTGIIRELTRRGHKHNDIIEIMKKYQSNKLLNEDIT